MTLLNTCQRFASAALLALLALPGCGGGATQVVDLPPEPAEKAPPAPKKKDAFADFHGETVEAGTRIKLMNDAVGVSGVNVVVRLLHASWTEMEGPDGEVIKSITAELRISKGDQTQKRTFEQGDTKEIYGATITLHDGGEDYDEKALDYVTWAAVTVK